jgi:hypothetical protein
LFDLLLVLRRRLSRRRLLFLVQLHLLRLQLDLRLQVHLLLRQGLRQYLKS